MRRRGVAAVLAALTLPVLTGIVTPAPASASTVAAPDDFDGDGRVDLAVGVPRLGVGGVPEAGGLAVLHGSRAGLSRSVRLLTRATPGVPGEPAADDGFGRALASADFDGDGYADLAVAADGGRPGSGGTSSLLVIPGSRHGLDPARAVGVPRLHPTLPGGDAWAGPLVTGDLDGDGYPDLAVGSPLEGLVRVFRGGKDGLGTSPTAELRNPGDEVGFGGVLATGDVDGDGVADLVVGAYGVQVDEVGLPGAVSLCLGRPENAPAGCHPLVRGDQLADLSSLAVGDVVGDARAEVVAGDGGWSDQAAGAVHVLRLSGSGPAIVADDLVLTQSSPGVPGTDERGDRFGEVVALADLDRDGWDDLVIGAPGENHGAGRVTVVHGARDGWATEGNRTFDQGTRGIPGRAEGDDELGGQLALLDHDGDGRPDLDVTAQGEDGRGGLTTLGGVRGGFTTHDARSAVLRGVTAPVDGVGQRLVLGG